jgi:predicted alpha-1,2-mannosidase
MSTRRAAQRSGLALAIAAAAGLLTSGWHASASAPAAQAAQAHGVQAHATPARATPARAGAVQADAPAGVCSKTANGTVTNCPQPVSHSMLPALATDNAPMATLPSNLAAFVDTRTWTSGGGNTFPGADVPFGMVQWSPDTAPGRTDGGGYTYGDKKLIGYSLTHVSGPGCPAAGDIPILPMTGALPAGNPSAVTTSFTNAGEVAQAGYYSARSNMPSTITSSFSATPHAAIGQFTFPKTTAADFLIKLRDSEEGDFATNVWTVNDHQIAGQVTSGGFCNESSKVGAQKYTVYFDIDFSEPFKQAKIITEPGQADPNAAFLTFNTKTNPTVDAAVGISYVKWQNAQLNWETEIPAFDLSAVKAAAQSSWNSLLSEILVGGGSVKETQEFYSLLYKDFLQPNIISDVNGQYFGSDWRVHALAPGQSNQYGMFSGWDIYHSLAQLQAMLEPTAASDMAQSLLNLYSENKILPQWGYLNLDNYAQVGDPADAIIADYYAFGATSFNTSAALADMLTQANTVNHVRPGEGLEKQYGFFPQNGSYPCCDMHDYVSSLLEYDTADLALSQYASAQGDATDAAALQKRANNWQNVFERNTKLFTPRYGTGKFLSGVTPTTSTKFLEGDAYEYLWDVPNNYAGLFSKLGGNAKVGPELRTYLSQPNGHGMHPYLADEFDLGEQFAPDYAGYPSETQYVVNNLRRNLYLPGPDGLNNNDDLGAESSQFIWEMLGFYPENPGSGNLVLASPGFSKIVISLPLEDASITINAPGASASKIYVDSLTINGKPDNLLYVPFSELAAGTTTLDFTLGTQPSPWGSTAADAPPSYGS